MKTIRGLFYKTPKFKWKYWVNWLISIRTMSKYSHCELQDPREDGKFSELIKKSDAKGEIFTACNYTTVTITEPVYELKFYGTCYTSTMRGDDNGTVKRDASLVLDHPENWDYIEIPLTDEQYASLITWMDYAVKHNKGYAMWDIMKFVSPVHFADNLRNICSEFCNNGTCAVNILKGWGIISPKAWLKKLLKCGYKVKSLKE